jgi:hypothetical protein
VKIRIVRGDVSEDGGRTWVPDWKVIDASAEPSDFNNYGILAYGCITPGDALSCAIEHGWVAPGRDA